MNFNAFLFGLVIGTFFYLEGYRAIALFVYVFAVAALFAGGLGPKKSRAPAGYEMGEPIIIESTRDAPFRIPASSWHRIKPKGGSEQAGGKFTKAEYTTFGTVAKRLGRWIRDRTSGD